ncbi:MAG: DUF998 domain-containing protein [Actinomycetota bacterium]|nr:DUF998 domain-containing protein [Actinomycetota bacterium]
MTRRRLAWGAVLAHVLFVGGWLLAGAIEGHGYSVGRHDISDLAALTAHHAWLPQASAGLGGALTMAFAGWALRPSLMAEGLRQPVGPWLAALSLPGLDNLGDAFFRLDCRAADAGCTASKAAAAWHGKAHIVIFAVAALATVIAPFALAHRMQRLDGWRDLARGSRIFGVGVVVLLAVSAAASGTGAQGSSQRVAATVIPLGVIALALRVAHLSKS